MSGLSARVAQLAPSFSGRLIEPETSGYEEARRVHNGLIDRHPALIAECRGLADIADAVRLGREQGLEIAVRGGGHNVAGRATTEGGLMIDLSQMRTVHVDPAARVARAWGGVTWRHFNRETQLYGLATPGGVVGTTGVSGLTLGGGLGWLMAKYGMALDNLLGVDVVLADGSIVRASADDNPDLFWALRGGGGNFGVAGALEFRLHKVGPTLVGGLAAWPFDHARDVLRFFRDVTASAPDEIMLMAALLTAPDGGGRLVAIAAAYCGPIAEGEAAVRPIKTFGKPVLDQLGPLPYVALNGMLDDAFPKGALNYWKSHFIDTLDDEVIDNFIESFTRCSSPMSQMLLEHFHGAAARVPVSDTAYALRATGYNALVLGEWADPTQTETCTRWVKDSYTALQPFVSSKRYLNYIGGDDDATNDALAAVYGPNLPRLRRLKREYDPDNVFRLNVNIPPA